VKYLDSFKKTKLQEEISKLSIQPYIIDSEENQLVTGNTSIGIFFIWCRYNLIRRIFYNDQE